MVGIVVLAVPVVSASGDGSPSSQPMKYEGSLNPRKGETIHSMTLTKSILPFA